MRSEMASIFASCVAVMTVTPCSFCTRLSNSTLYHFS